jgi:uncharacterized membrane protein YphA (DoxX/SURF4 family)
MGKTNKAMDTTVEKKLLGIQTLMKFVYGLVPIVAGADKFTNLLTTWDQYLNPSLAGMLPFSPGTFMQVVGVIEIVAGILVLVKPKVGAVVVGAWLALIALTLLASGRYLDVAVRDLVMAVGAFVLSRLTKITEQLIAKSV